MQQAQTSSPSALPATRTRLPGTSWPPWVAFACSFLIAMGLVVWDTVHNDSPDSHPLQTDRLWLRVVGLFFMAGCFAIPVTVVFRSLRWTTRLRKGLCR